jgi:hypothetical protein
MTGDSPFAKRWVHVFEEDTPEGQVYRPETAKIPLSRRPRTRLELDKDGSARLYVAGPDDRFIEQPGTWKEEGDDVVIRSRRGGTELRVIDRSEDRLVVRVSSAGATSSRGGETAHGHSTKTTKKRRPR